MTPETCPNCGAEVPRRAKACPACGADETSGWSEEAGSQNLDLPGEKFDYDEFVHREFGAGGAKPRDVSWLWWVVGVLLLAGMIWFLV